jgi:hypothetical protein
MTSAFRTEMMIVMRTVDAPACATLPPPTMIIN